LELLRELIPDLSRVAVLWDPRQPNHLLIVKETERAALSLGVQLQLLEARSLSELDNALTAMNREGAGAVLVISSPVTTTHRARVAEHAVQSRLPAMCSWRSHVEAGCLMSFSVDLPAQWRRAAYFVARILKGTKPADLPVEQPTKFEMVVNLKTAKALGLLIPPSLLLRADQVIE
jgi:putative ABC transport system substrate-binding protein